MKLYILQFLLAFFCFFFFLEVVAVISYKKDYSYFNDNYKYEVIGKRNLKKVEKDSVNIDAVFSSQTFVIRGGGGGGSSSSSSSCSSPSKSSKNSQKSNRTVKAIEKKSFFRTIIEWVSQYFPLPSSLRREKTNGNKSSQLKQKQRYGSRMVAGGKPDSNTRIQKELEAFLTNPPENCKLSVGKNIRTWVVTLTGVEGTVFAGEQYRLKVCRHYSVWYYEM